jgi:hypothetical protein
MVAEETACVTGRWHVFNIPMATGEICQCWQDEINALAIFPYHYIEHFALPLQTDKCKIEDSTIQY